MKTINQLREQIAGLKAERLAILRQGRSRDEVRSCIDAWLSAAEQQGHDALQIACDRALAGQAFNPCHIHGNAAVFEAPGAAPVSLDMGPLLLAFLGKSALKKALSGIVDVLPEGLSPQEKAKRLKTIEAELYSLEVAEEAAIVDAESAGESILRRPDARPEIILA